MSYPSGLLKGTKYLNDFVCYYKKAQEMEKKSLGKPYEEIDDPLMENVHIYNITERKNAGFSNILEDMWRGNNKEQTFAGAKLPGILPMEKQCFDIYTWHYLFLLHRITGSGASFDPDHGYRNTVIPDLLQYDNMFDMTQHIKSVRKPIFTSKGNQIPPFNKPNPPYDKGGIEYLCEVAPILVCSYVDWLMNGEAPGQNEPRPVGIKEAVDWCLDWQSNFGWKRFKFVLTAFVMDTAEYYPQYVDPKSHCYYGKNALEAMDLLFGKYKYKPSIITKSKRYDVIMEYLCFLCKKNDNKDNYPYNIEDVLCDYIRYVENYVPKWYLDNVEYDKLLNNSLVPDHRNLLMEHYMNILNKPPGLFDA